MKQRNPLSILLLATLFLSQGNLSAQNLPSESPKSKIIQRIGLSDISITYSRPGIKGRRIFGGLVPYDSVWRTGADYPTFIRLADTTYFGANKYMLSPAKYALYTIPSNNKWTIILSKDTLLWGAFGYKQKNDAFRFDVPVITMNQSLETFTITFSDVEDNKANIVLQWEKTMVSFPISVNIDHKIIQYVKERIQAKNEPFIGGICRNGARYLLKHRIENALALEWINISLEKNADWENLWLKAQILAWGGNYKEAIMVGQSALIDGTSKEQAPYFPYEDIYQSEIEKWKIQIRN